jgi:hypothetical protein
LCQIVLKRHTQELNENDARTQDCFRLSVKALADPINALRSPEKA